MKRQNLTCWGFPGKLMVLELQEQEWEFVLTLNSPVGKRLQNETEPPKDTLISHAKYE